MQNFIYKKILLSLFIVTFFCGSSFAEDYYFNNCKLNEKLVASYSINFEENYIEVNLRASDGTQQTLFDEIKSVSKDQIVSKLLVSSAGEGQFFQYYLDVESKSVIKQQYRKDKTNLIRLYGPKEQNFCKDVKSDWNEDKIRQAEEKNQQEIKAQEERKRKEEKRKQAEKELKKIEELEKMKSIKQHVISIDSKKWIKLSKYNSDSGKKLKKDFDQRAAVLCAGDNKFDIVEKTIVVIGMDETPAFGTETKILLGIQGVIECKN